ncbi:UNVERIFIED_CONTAM: transmembrane protein [Trichonephila clavipes]
MDLHDAKNRQCPCRMIKRHVKNPLNACLTRVLLAEFHIVIAQVPHFREESRWQNYIVANGKVLEALSTLLLLTMLIFIAKGYTVTRGRLRKKTLLKIAAFLWLYVIVYVILFLYERKFFDPGKVLYMYESPAGYGIIGLRLVGWAWFVYAVIFTMMHYPEKSNFYTKLFLLYSLW